MGRKLLTLWATLMVFLVLSAAVSRVLGSLFQVGLSLVGVVHLSPWVAWPVQIAVIVSAFAVGGPAAWRLYRWGSGAGARASLEAVQ